MTENRSRRRRVGLVGALVGAAAAGIAAGVAAERYLVRRSRGTLEDPYTDESFGRLPFDSSRTVTTPDDVDVHVEVIGGPSELTVVFVHGFCLDMGTFHFQRVALDHRYRMVFYDQPGHGRSGKLPPGTEYSLDMLGRTLAQVIEETAPEGPIVLVGHSMGGMAIMALAEQRPQLFERRVVGVALISSSTGRLSEVSFGLPDFVTRIRRPLMPVLTSATRLTPRVLDRARRASSDLAWLLTRRYGFGGANPSAALISYVERMNSTTSMDVIAGYLGTLFAHGRAAALEALQGVEVLVVSGEKDMLTPLAHSEEICRLLPGAELVVVPDGGHVVLLEFAEEVNDALAEFLLRAERIAESDRESDRTEAGEARRLRRHKLFRRRSKPADAPEDLAS